LASDESETSEATVRKAHKYIFAKVVVLSILAFIQFAFPSASLNDAAVWFFVWWLDIWCMLDVWTYLKWKSEKNPSFTGLRYYLTLGTSILGVFGLFLLGASQMYLRISSIQGRILVFSVFLGWLLLLISSFGWMEVWERYRDPYLFLAEYCAAIQIIFLTLVLNSTVVDRGKFVALYELAVSFSSDSPLIYYCLLTSVVLIVVYLTPIGRNLMVRRLTAVIPPVNVVLIFAIGIHFDTKWTEYGLGTMVLSVFLGLSGVFPQLYWALNPRNSKPTGPDSSGNLDV
jgi:hypothetical protein